MINIVLYQPEIAPNTGNIIRTVHAIGAKLHIIQPTAFDLHPKWFKRAATGKLLSDIPHEIHKNFKEYLIKYGNSKTIYTTRYGKKLYSDVDYTYEDNEDIFIMFGRESTGLPMELLRDNLETSVRIPMVEGARSLNLSTTVMLLGYEAQRQNNFKGLSVFESQKGENWILDFDK